MVNRGKTQFVLLGLLANGPKSGYDIKQTIERSIGYFWQESYGQIYPVLRRLTEQKYILKKEISRKGKPDKNVYSITNTGTSYFRQWLMSPIETAPQRNAMLLRLFFGNQADTRSNIDILENHIKNCSEMLSSFIFIKNSVEEKCVIDSGPVENSTYSMITLDYGISSLKMEIEWAKKSIQLLKNQFLQNSPKSGRKS